MEENILLISIMIYWLPIYIYLFIYSVKIRVNNYKRKKELKGDNYLLNDMDILAEVLIYCSSVYLGIFMFFLLPKNLLKSNIILN